MQILPNQSWTLPTQDNGPGAGIANIGNVFGDPMQNALQKQKAALTAREIAGQGQLGALFSHPGAVDNATASAAIANGVDPKTLGEVFRLTNNLNGGVDSDLAARAGAGIGQFTSTPLYQQRAEQAATARTAQSAQIAADAQARAAGIQAQSQLHVAGLEPVQITNPDGSVGWTTKAAIATGHAPQGAQPLISPDLVKGALAQHGLLPQPGGAPAPAAPAHNWGPAHAGGSPSGPIVADPSWTPPADPAAAAPAGPQMTPDQRQFIGLDQPTKLELKQTGADTMGNPTFSKFDPSTGEITPISPQGAPGAAPSLTDTGPHGDEFLATLPPEIQPMVKGIANGTIQPPAATTRNGRPNPILMAVTQYDPNFDAANTQARFNTAKDFGTGGKSGQIVGSAGSALGHLGEVMNQIPGLSNHDTAIPGNDVFNAGKNAMLGGSAAAGLNAYKEAIQRFGGEIEKFYTATGGTEAERAASMASLSPDKSPSELYAAASTLGRMLQTRIDQLGSQRDQIMGPNAPAYPRFGPEAQASLQALDALNKAHAASGRWDPKATAPLAPGVTAQDPDYVPAGRTMVGKGGTNYVSKGGSRYDKETWQALPGGK